MLWFNVWLDQRLLIDPSLVVCSLFLSVPCSVLFPSGLVWVFIYLFPPRSVWMFIYHRLGFWLGPGLRWAIYRWCEVTPARSWMNVLPGWTSSCPCSCSPSPSRSWPGPPSCPQVKWWISWQRWVPYTIPPRSCRIAFMIVCFSAKYDAVCQHIYWCMTVHLQLSAIKRDTT